MLPPEKAWGLETDQIEGPAWLKTPSYLYSVTATMPASTTKAEFRLMPRNLLAERFQLTAHMEKSEFPAYALVVAKGGPKLKPSPPESEAPAPPEQSDGGPRKTEPDVAGFPILRCGRSVDTQDGKGVSRSTHRQTMAEFADMLWALMQDSEGYRDVRPRVIDKTGLTGKFDFTLETNSTLFGSLPLLAGRGGDAASGDPAGGGPSIFTALEKQLGLRLEKTAKTPLDVLVIDHAEKVPTDN